VIKDVFEGVQGKGMYFNFSSKSRMRLKVIMSSICLFFIAIFFSSLTMFNPGEGKIDYSLEISVMIPEDDFIEEFNVEEFIIPDMFEKAEIITGIPVEILLGIAAAESDFISSAIGDKGLSHGMFQLHSEWHDSRVSKWGEFDPFNPEEAVIIAGKIMAENLAALNGDLNKAIAAYRQGVGGVRKNGATDWYINAVLNWRECENKIKYYTIFLEISNFN
jgi:hypothetical protein